MSNAFERCYVNLTCFNNDEYLKDVFEICGQTFSKLKYFNFGYHVLQIDVRDEFDFKCIGQINGSCWVADNNKYLKIVGITVKKKNLAYNIYHTFGHFLQKYIFNEQKNQRIYQQYLENSDIFSLPNDYSVIKEQCIPQLMAHYFCNQLNGQTKKFVQKNILK